MSSENVVVYAGRQFHLEEPTTDHVIAILNVIGSVAVRAESTAARLVKNPTNRAVLFGVLAAMNKEDLVSLGRAVLQFPLDREGRREAKEFFGQKGVRVAPLVRALMINLKLSTDLVEALKAFFDGIGGIEALLDAIAPAERPEEEDEKTTKDTEDG
jgi:hypothetical protein